MKTTITYENHTYTEANNQKPQMVSTSCGCGNRLYVPSLAIQLGLVTDCGHCGKDYPEVAHCKAVTDAYLSLIEDGGEIDLN